MQYLLTKEEFESAIPRAAVEPFLKATADYYERKNAHLCELLKRSDLRVMSFNRNPIEEAVKRHRDTWTEQPPKPEDFIPK